MYAEVIAASVDSGDQYQKLRTYAAGPLYAPVTGYYSLRYGTSGIERTRCRSLSSHCRE